MVEVGGKDVTRREARASGRIAMAPQTVVMVRDGTLPKGNAVETARVAAIMAAKATPSLIPLCHPLLITGVNCDLHFDTASGEIEVTVTVRCNGQTGVEMEALTAVSAALLTIWDMTKAVDENLEILGVHLDEKRGGKSGLWNWKEQPVRIGA